MITLRNVSHFRPGTRRKVPIVLDASLHCAARDRIGILAVPGSGKSSLARLFCGIDQPDVGQVKIEGRIGWPLGFAGFLHPELTVGQNIAIVSKICGFAPSHAQDFVCDFTEISNVLPRRTEDLSPSERALVAYGISLAIPSNYVIADEVITLGARHMREKCEALLEERLRSAGLILIARSARRLRRHCDTFHLLIGHRLKPCPDIEAGERALEMQQTNASETELEHV